MAEFSEQYGDGRKSSREARVPEAVPCFWAEPTCLHGQRLLDAATGCWSARVQLAIVEAIGQEAGENKPDPLLLWLKNGLLVALTDSLSPTPSGGRANASPGSPRPRTASLS